MKNIDIPSRVFSIPHSVQYSTMLMHFWTPCSRIRDASSSSYVVPHIVWNLKVNCCVHMSPTPVPILSQINPVHSLYLIFNACFNIIFYSTPVYQLVLAFRFPQQNPMHLISSPHTPTLCLTVMMLIIRACHYCIHLSYKNVTLLKLNLIHRG